MHSRILAIKKNEILPFATVLMDLKILGLVKSLRERQIFFITCMWNLWTNVYNKKTDPKNKLVGEGRGWGKKRV